MQYVFLIYVNEEVISGLSDEDQAAYFQQYAAFEGSVQEAGIKSGGRPLEPISTATTVRIRADNDLITDGPFAETKEQLAGFYVLECANLDEAIEHAKRMPDARHGAIEIRPVFNKYNY